MQRFRKEKLIIENKTSIEIVVRLTVREFSLKRPAVFLCTKTAKGKDNTIWFCRKEFTNELTNNRIGVIHGR